MDDQIKDHAFEPSKRPDSCDFTDWQTWLVCDYPDMAHRRDSDAPASPTSAGRSDADDAR